MAQQWIDEMRRDYDRGMAEFQRREKRRQRARRIARRICAATGTAVGVILASAIGAAVTICAFFSDAECSKIFRAMGVLP